MSCIKRFYAAVHSLDARYYPQYRHSVSYGQSELAYCKMDPNTVLWFPGETINPADIVYCTELVLDDYKNLTEVTRLPGENSVSKQCTHHTVYALCSVRIAQSTHYTVYALRSVRITQCTHHTVYALHTLRITQCTHRTVYALNTLYIDHPVLRRPQIAEYGSPKGWMTRQIFFGDQNQHVLKPNWVKLQCNRHSRSALKSVLKMAKLAPSEKTCFFLKGRSLIGHLYDV